MAAPAVLAAVLLSGCAGTVVEGPDVGSPPVAATAVGDAPAGGGIELEGLQPALDAIADAFAVADPDALRPWLHDPESGFGRRWLARAGHLAGVPLSRYRLELDASLPDLATDRLRRRYDDPVALVYVVEEHSLAGFDVAGPARESLFLTMVRTADGWRAASDADGEPMGLVSVDHLWDHGPVVATRRGRLMALHHPGTDDVEAVLADAESALGEVVERWPLRWPERVPLLIPRDQDELAELLHVTFDLSTFVAFATATPSADLDDYELTGTRIVLNTAPFLARSGTTRQRILVHELTHAATRPVAGPFVPSWLEEGVAQALGERRSTTGTVLIDALVAGGSEVELPTDAAFTVAGRDRIFLSYQLAWSFLDHLVERYGAPRVAAFYAAAGRGAIGRPGTEAWHVDRAAREVLGAPLDDLRSSWREALG